MPGLYNMLNMERENKDKYRLTIPNLMKEEQARMQLAKDIVKWSIILVLFCATAGATLNNKIEKRAS